MKDMESFPVCFPPICSRVVMKNVLQSHHDLSYIKGELLFPEGIFN